MEARFWMIRYSGERVVDSLELQDVVNDIQSGDLVRCASRVYSWMCAVLDWGKVALEVLQGIRNAHEDGEEIVANIVGVKIELDKLEFLRKALLRYLVVGDMGVDSDRVALWYMEGRIASNAIIRLLDLDTKFVKDQVEVYL